MKMLFCSFFCINGEERYEQITRKLPQNLPPNGESWQFLKNTFISSPMPQNLERENCRVYDEVVTYWKMRFGK